MTQSRQWRADDFRDTSPYHVHQTSPVPLGSESARPTCFCWKGRQGRRECDNPEKCSIDAATSSDWVSLQAEITSQRVEPYAVFWAVVVLCLAFWGAVYAVFW